MKKYVPLSECTFGSIVFPIKLQVHFGHVKIPNIRKIIHFVIYSLYITVYVYASQFSFFILGGKIHVQVIPMFV